MSFDTATRLSDSPYVEAIMHGYTIGSGSTIRPAECHWHMVFTRFQGKLLPIFTGPLPTFGTVSFTEGAEILWIKFKLGTFMPHLPHRDFLNSEIVLPEAAGSRFWLKGSAWQFPHYENIDTFVDWLVREEVLVYDPTVNAVLEGQPHDMAARTVRHRFLHATGLTQTQIFQIERAQRAAALLAQGVPILDTVYEVGYFDQPHLTRALKQWIGHTPAEILRTSLACRFVQDSDLSFDYHADVVT